MAVPPDWSADTAVAACTVGPWSGIVWRAHNRKFDATDHGGTLITSGRYHQGADLVPGEPTWPALYLALARDTALAEVIRQITPVTLPFLAQYRFTRIQVTLTAVVDCSDPTALSLERADLCNDTDLTIPRAVARAARSRSVEGMLVPSATTWGNNLVIFPDLRRPGSSFEILDYTEPLLLKA